MKLEIELIPSSSFFSNVRSEVTQEKWDELRKDCYKKAFYKCEICGGKGNKWPVECHEVWEYKWPVQKLIRLIALCPDCHMVKHFGLATLKGNRKRALNHLMKVNQWSENQAEKHITKAFKEWEKRSQKEWALDLSAIGIFEDNF
jgi:hypothetical protein